MTFSSMTFLWIFLPSLLFIYNIVNKKWKNLVLTIFSLIFYAWGEPVYILLLLASILVNYAFGIIMDQLKNDLARKLTLTICIIIDLGVLIFFKYINFIIDNINAIAGHEAIKFAQIALPIGISFFTFQIMSYVIDLYRGTIKAQYSLLNLTLYISLFPQMIAGPIVKYKDVEKELRLRKVTANKFANGVKFFIIGLAKKVMIANSAAKIADYCYGLNINEIGTGLVWIGAVAYMIQIYFDFSGYSDMAIGLGKMFGFKFMKNFDDPYMATSISDFWKRWHISLTSWFREYLYIPLGGNRKGSIRTYINIFIVFLVTGIWHGAAWTFIVWGVFNGIIMIIERIGLKKWLDACPIRILCRIYTCFIVLLSWVMFRTDTIAKAFQYYSIMFIPRANGLRIYDLSEILNRQNVSMLALGFIFAFIVPYIKNVSLKPQIKTFYKTIVEPFILCLVYIACIMLLVANTYNPFIYFRF